MISARSADLSPLVSRNAVRESIADALRLYVGRGCRYSVKQLSNATGVKDRVIESAMVPAEHPDNRPLKICELLSIAMFLGPDFTTEWLSLAQQGAFAFGDDAPPPGELAADNSEDNAVLTRAAMDGRFDDEEKPGLRSVGLRMVARGQQIVAAAA
jgi:hypothetical protein